MVYRFLQKRKGFVIRTEGEASLNSSTACGRFGVSKARSASAMKWQNKLAQGFYEADFVKTALLKSIF
jgi:glutamate synthase domain-containing protein 2